MYKDLTIDDILDEICNESFSETKDKILSKTSKVGDKLEKPMSKGFDTAARGIVSARTIFSQKIKKGTDEFEQEVKKCSASLKAGAIAVGNVPAFICPIPGASIAFNTLFTYPLVKNDPVLKSRMNNLKSAFNKFTSDVKSGVYKTADSIKTAFYKLVSNGHDLAKNIDKVNDLKTANINAQETTNYIIEDISLDIKNGNISSYTFFKNIATYIEACDINDPIGNMLLEYCN